MNQWEVIRLRVVRDGEPIKRVAREMELAPNTVRKYVREIDAPAPPKYRRRAKLDDFLTAIDALLESTPKITAKRIGDVLRERHDALLVISESALRKFVAKRRRSLVPSEAFVRAEYAPGDQAQFDFSPMQALVDGTLTTVQIFAMRLSYSGNFFARASCRQDRPALFAGLLGAISSFGGLPRIAIFDNAKTAVTKVLRGRDREENAEFRAFRGAPALEVQFAAPRRGNEKGGVEGLMGYIEDNVFRPIPSFASIAELNAALERLAAANLERVHATHHERIGDRFERERLALRPLPERLPDPCIVDYARVNKFAEVTAETNRYSVPTAFVRRDALVQVYDEQIVVVVDGAVVARHRRAQGRNTAVIDPLHYVDLISRKHRSATHALAFAQERLPRSLVVLRDRLLEHDERTATKVWTEILRLALESSLPALSAATEIALARGTLDPQAIALILRQPRAARLRCLTCVAISTSRQRACRWSTSMPIASRRSWRAYRERAASGRTFAYPQASRRAGAVSTPCRESQEPGRLSRRRDQRGDRTPPRKRREAENRRRASPYAQDARSVRLQRPADVAQNEVARTC